MRSNEDNKGKKKNEKYIFHPLEIAFCGYSNSGKTTLISSLLKEIKDDYKIAYIKHDAHRFDIDHEGKDTNVMYKSGANTVFINDQDHFAIVGKNSLNTFSMKSILSDFDLVFIEGYKNLPTPKIVLIDKDKKILNSDQPLENIIAFIGQDKNPPIEYENFIKSALKTSEEVPYFERNNILAIKDFIKKFINKKISKIPLFGLLLTGGRSSRMGQDKAKISYHNQPQYQYYHKLLSKYCDQTFLSCRTEQASEFNLPCISDRFLDIGPACGILSAMTLYPNTAFLVLACDLPFVTLRTIETLISNRNPVKNATSYKNSDGLPEPLCSIYEPKSKQKFFELLASDHLCPRKVLMNSEIVLIENNHTKELENINYPEECKRALDVINNKGL